MQRLSLDPDTEVTARVRRYAGEEGTSLAELAGADLSAGRPPDQVQNDGTSILNSLRGVLKQADQEDYRKHLREKYL
jgi:hypothetical protein